MGEEGENWGENLFVKAEGISDVFWLAFGVLSIYGSFELGLGTLSEPGSGFFAFLASLFICLMALANLLWTLLAKGGIQSYFSSLWSGANWWRPLILVLLLLSFIIALEKIGFILSTFFIMLTILKGLEKLPWIKAVLISGISTASAYFLFVSLLKVALPRGLIWF